MKQNKFGELIFSESDVVDLLMQGRAPETLKNLILDSDIDTSSWSQCLDSVPEWHKEVVRDCTVEEFHATQQSNWHMPPEYKNMDIAKYVLDLCNDPAQLQRCGEELLMYQERGLFDLLRYLKYLVDSMMENHVVWGVGRGSSVASYVLYKLGVHRIDSMFYDLDPGEFLR